MSNKEKQLILKLAHEFSMVKSLEQMQGLYEWFSLVSGVKKDDEVKGFMHSTEFTEHVKKLQNRTVC